MKTLLANEMLNEPSAKKRSPSLIAKLMGLDGLPSPQPIHRQQKKLSENSHKSTAKRNEKPLSYQLDKKSTMEQLYFKDVYEDPEASHVGNQLYSPTLTARRRSTKQELGYIQERCDEMLRESIAIKTKLERVDSNSDLLLRFQHKEQQNIPFVSQCNQITLLKPSISVRHGVHQRRMNEEKETLKYRGPVSHHRHKDELLGYSCHSTNNSRRSSRYQLESNDAIAISPTRIVVLKPNVAMFYNDQTYVHSPDEFRKNTESESRSTRHKSREAREIAKHITSQMKEGFENGHSNLFDYGYGGYASPSASESEMLAVSSRNSFERRRSPSNMSESAVIREAKKRMSRRWKTYGYKDEGTIGKSSTLEEMLSVPNSEIRHGKTKSVVGLVEVNDEHGWREGYQRSTSRSRSLPPSSSNRSHRTSNYHEPHADEKIIVHNESLHRGKSKGGKGDFYHREDSRSKNLRNSKRCQSSEHCNACSPEFDNILPTETYYEKENPAEQKSLISDIYGATTNAAAESSKEVKSGLPTWMLGDANSFDVDENSSNSQV